MADLEFYQLSMTGEEADRGIRTGMEAGATSGILLGDGNGGVTAATPGRDFGYPLLAGNGPPTGNTAANIGQHYFDMQATQAPYEYICVGLNSNGFIWIVFGDTGDGFKISGYFASLETLEAAISAGTVAAPTAGTAYGIGEVAPYDIYVWDATNSTWVNNGPLGASGGGSGVPPHGDTGQVLVKFSDADYDAGWGQVSTPGIANGSVTAEKLAQGAVTTPGIADGTVTLPKIASSAFDSAPVEGSGKIITSGAVAAALANVSGGLTMTMLWENASPTSSYAAQTITVDVQAYDAYLMIARINTGYNYLLSVTAKNGCGAIFSAIWGDVGTYSHRSIVWEANGLKVNNAYYSRNEDNAQMIPVAIYGINGVT